MNRYAKNRDLPHLPPVEKVELPARPSGARIAAVAFLLVVGAAALSYAVYGLVTGEKGWQRIEAAGAETTAAQDFALVYELGAGDASAAAENRALSAQYGAALNTAWQLFDAYQGYDGVNNLYTLNQQPNTELEVAPALYAALEQLQAAQDRTMYLGPVYELYDDVFSCRDDAQAAEYDPAQSPDMAAYYAAVAAYAADPAMVDVRLLGENRVCLYVAPEYERFAAENEIAHYLDLFWLKNAFIVDELAGALTAAGFTHGAISSTDGFVRNLDNRDLSYDLPLAGGTVHYWGPCSFATMGARASGCYTFADGHVLTMYLDPQDGVCRAALPECTAAGRTLGCAGLALRLAPLYIADTFESEKAAALERQGVYLLYEAEGALVCRLPDAGTE